MRIRGRGAASDPANRFDRLHVELDPAEHEEDAPSPRTRFYRDHTRIIVARNESPDVGFAHSVNPYRGCEHGCVYCFARPFHEYLGLSAGLDFETRIFVKEDAPELLRKELSSPRWEPAPIAFSGVTDPYQPVERRLRLTRRCLEVMAAFGNPVAVVTKGALVARDADVLARLAAHDAAAVYISVTSLDPTLQRAMEPRAPTPARRLEAMHVLADAGVPVGVMVAPVVPGLTDHEIPAIVEACAAAGATRAGFVPLRLPHAVAALFDDWLRAHLPERREKVLGRVREMRGGKLYDSAWGTRMRGEGPYADQLRALFEVACRRAGVNGARLSLSTAGFRRPGQLSLFGGGAMSTSVQ